MITHNMQSALDLGNRILMMDSGDIVLDIHEEEKKGLTVEGLRRSLRQVPVRCWIMTVFFFPEKSNYKNNM